MKKIIIDKKTDNINIIIDNKLSNASYNNDEKLTGYTEPPADLDISACTSKNNYITICGPDQLGRFGQNRNINLVEYLPQYLRGGETEDFLVLFEEFMNNMFDGEDGWVTNTSALAINQNWAEFQQIFSYSANGSSAQTDATDAQYTTISWPSNANLPTSQQKISILEKVARLTELHDPTLIDIDYIQFFAANLGYNVNVSRNEVGVSGTSDNWGTTEFGGSCSAADINKYLRFVIENLPSWYKIKTTRNAIKVMLYSFGLVADIIEYFTDSYYQVSEGGKWRANFKSDLSDINNNWFPTPHFAIYVEFDLSSDISFEVSRRQKVVRAIESIRPVNAVFRKLTGYVERMINLYVGAYIRCSRYTIIKSNGYSNGWGKSNL